MTTDVQIPNDWRYSLFGPNLLLNSQGDKDEESPDQYIDTTQAFDGYEYIAIFMGANYCPHCREFAPTVVSSAAVLEKQHGCKVVFVSNDRDEENFQASCKKTAGIDVVPYNLERTRAMRDLFGLATIPALMILRNDNFEKPPQVVTNARNKLAADPQATQFPWVGNNGNNKNKTWSARDRLIISGEYGQWWELGHHVNKDKPEEMYMDEHAVRARAGILNIISWIAIINVFFWQEPDYVMILFPLVAWEFLTSMTFGLTPLAPVGILGTLLATKLNPEPLWKPARPKRFAWAIGLTLATMCLSFVLARDHLGDAYRPLVGAVALTCNLATWLEGSCGFCLGCFIYNTYLVKWFELEECDECKL